MIEKQQYFGERVCPRCHRAVLKTWGELSADEKFIAERQAASAEFEKSARARHLFCPQCWFETADLETRA